MPRQPNSKTYRPEEVTKLLNAVEQVLPRGMEEWNDVCAQFNDGLLSGRRRTADQVRQKWNNLLTTRDNTGNPTRGAQHQRALAIRGQINVHVASQVIDDGDQGDEDQSSSDQDEDQNLGHVDDDVDSQSADEEPKISVVAEPPRPRAQTVPEQRRAHRSLLQDAIAHLAALADRITATPIQQLQQQDLSGISLGMMSIHMMMQDVHRMVRGMDSTLCVQLEEIQSRLAELECKMEAKNGNQ